MKSLKRNLLFSFALAAFLFSIPNYSIANTFLPISSDDSNVELADALKIKIKIIIIIIIKKKKKGIIGEIKGMQATGKEGRLGENEFYAEATIEDNKFIMNVAGLKENVDMFIMPKGFGVPVDNAKQFDRKIKLKGGKLKPTKNKLGNFEIQDLMIK